MAHLPVLDGLPPIRFYEPESWVLPPLLGCASVARRGRSTL